MSAFFFFFWSYQGAQLFVRTVSRRCLHELPFCSYLIFLVKDVCAREAHSSQKFFSFFIYFLLFCLTSPNQYKAAVVFVLFSFYSLTKERSTFTMSQSHSLILTSSLGNATCNPAMLILHNNEYDHR